MSSSDVKKVYEIRDGADVLGQFSIKSKAMAFKKECSAEGRKVKVFVRFIKDSERKPEPRKIIKTVPKDVPKPAPKETPGKAPAKHKAVPSRLPHIRKPPSAEGPSSRVGRA